MFAPLNDHCSGLQAYFERAEFGWDFCILPAGNLDTLGELAIGGHTIDWELTSLTYALY